MQFGEFWPRYLRAHSRPATRAVHYGATLLGVASAVAMLVTLDAAFLIGIPVAYAMAIGAHIVLEKNQSLIRVNPFWGAVADLRMFWLALTGRLGQELRRQGIARRMDSNGKPETWSPERFAQRSGQ